MPFIYRIGFAAAAIFLFAVAPASSQQIPTAPLVAYTDGMLVTSSDITVCPYRPLATVSVNMRAHSYALKELETAAIADKLRRKARKMGADAVVLVTVGQTHMTLTSLRSTPVTGRAIKYVNPSCAPKS